MNEQEMDRLQHAQDEAYMRLALEEARQAAKEGEVPIGALVVYDPAADTTPHRYGGEDLLPDGQAQDEGPRIIARAHNRRELDEDPSAHAEFIAMRRAARELRHWRLSGCTVYVTLEPCLMCAGLMVNARIDRCVYGAADPKGGALGSLFDVSHDERLNHEFAVTSGVLTEEGAVLLRDFFRDRRKQARAKKKEGTARA